MSPAPRFPMPPIPLQADEQTTLVAFLGFYRAALLDRATGLDHADLQVALPPSTLTLARLIGHMAYVEEWWFRFRFAGDEVGEPFVSLDWETDVDAEMTLAGTWSVAELFDRFDRSVADADRRVGEAASLDQLSAEADHTGERWSLRYIIVHLIEEYARHCGHADLIRESIDGNVANA